MYYLCKFGSAVVCQKSHKVTWGRAPPDTALGVNAVEPALLAGCLELNNTSESLKKFMENGVKR